MGLSFLLAKSPCSSITSLELPYPYANVKQRCMQDRRKRRTCARPSRRWSCHTHMQTSNKDACRTEGREEPVLVHHVVGAAIPICKRQTKMHAGQKEEKNLCTTHVQSEVSTRVHLNVDLALK